MASGVGAWIVLVVLLAGSIGAVLVAAPPSLGPSAGTCVLKYRQAGTPWTGVTTVDRAKSPVSYYDYYSASAHTDFVQAYVSKAYFYRDTTTGSRYFFFHHNIDEGGSSDATVDIVFGALPAGVQVVVSDDPGEFQLGRSPQAQEHFWLNTDGGVLGPLPAGAWDFTMTPTWGGTDPMTSWRFVDGNGTHHPLDMAKTLELASVCNQAPTARAGGPYVGYEGSAITFNASLSSDPDGDPLRYRWDFLGNGSFTAWSSSPVATFTWGDDWTGAARVEVSDGEFTANATAGVTVLNVPPTVSGIRAEALANLTLRVAGEKWHDVTLEVRGPSGILGTASVTRYPGSPDEQRATVQGGPFDLLDANLSVVVRYTPWDDPVNGQPQGANPAWLILTPENGTEVWVHHTFNVNHPGTWNWTVSDLRVFLPGVPLRLEATAHDPGSDDLTFVWSWGDGTPNATATFYNNGVGPDPHPSPEVHPITVTDDARHPFASAGTFTVSLTVTDDDGGNATSTTTITIP